jgi:hypothetical protein
MEVVRPHLRYYPGIGLEELRKYTQNLIQYRLCPVRDSNQAPPKYN